MMVEIGLDRMHHAFWRFLDPEHPRYEPGHRYGDAIRSYYVYLDEEIGELLERFDEDTTVLVVSDHGARPMQGAICINEWLVQEGYLVLEEPPAEPIPFSEARVDWSRTRAWGEGGYYCRLCVNVAGREPQGLVAPEDVEQLLDELADRLERLPGPDGEAIGTRVFRPDGAVARAARHPARPDRLLRRSRLAQQRQPRPRPPLDATTTTPAPTTPTTTATACASSPVPGVPVAAARGPDDLRHRADDPRPSRPAPG